MRLNYILSDLGIGLRRNLSMTIAVVVTIWVSLSLFGSALLAREQVDLMKGNWYDKIQISIFLCTKDSGGRGCAGTEVTTEQKNRIKQAIETNPDTAPEGVYGESKKEAFEQFKKLYKDSPIVSTVTEDQMQESFRVKLKDPQRYQNLISAVSGLPGVDTVQDLRQYLDPLFNALNKLRWGALLAAGLLLVAALMQISNTIRLAAYARRREIGIMRLVGASNFYIQLPFLLEAILAALIGAVLACGTLWLGVYFLVKKQAEETFRVWQWVGATETFRATLIMVVVGLVLAVVPTFLTTRKYLKV
ncbi:permease-like cell division protein FtsX [Kribbella sp. CA-293567]|uniref:permease-like cell division protein FtsX n=1 Tax=Kribbella sp. CA-293567 TaxID=3002436 RepID=UPI0022DDB9DD|nr:permease-like cell division protein FtsX [Kribbella sp. CA-293567]WBQ03744.1 permease-like cell division protein FtsX [Kribbella sp. CA-293567]